jgi:hypothetical protein
MSITLSNPCPWGWQSRGFTAGAHRGIDYGWYNADPAGSRRVIAAAPGRVIEIYNGGGWNQGWGSRVMIEHTDRAKTTYSHHPKNGINLTVGQLIDRGQAIGPMGNTGDAGKPPAIHSHFELYIDNVRVDPAPYFAQALPGNPVRSTAPPAAPALGVRDRLTGVQGANGRTQPAATGPAVLTFRNLRLAMIAFTDAGQSVQGNARWYRSVNGLWYWSGGFTSTAKTGLADLTPLPPAVELPAEPTPEPIPEPTPEPTPEPAPAPIPEPTPAPEPPTVKAYTMPSFSTPLTPDVILPANLRAGLYLGNWAAGVILAAIAAAVVAIEAPVHPALVAAIAVYGVLSSAVSALARANTTTTVKS